MSAAYRVLVTEDVYGCELVDETFATLAEARAFASAQRRKWGPTIYTDYDGGPARVEVEIHCRREAA